MEDLSGAPRPGRPSALTPVALGEPEVRRGRSQRVHDFEDHIRKNGGQRLLIAIKGPPDPDSIASAWAQHMIAAELGMESTILYFDSISHQENRALVKSLEIELIRYTEKVNVSGYRYYALVDTQKPGMPIEPSLLEEMTLLTFVDHHKNTGEVEAEFVDIREDCGSTSAIFAEYLERGSVGLQPGNPMHSKLATALMHGIKTDTDNFFAARQIDFRAASYLSQYADMDLLRVISTQSMSPKVMDILHRALENKEVRDNYIISGVGFVRSEDRDGIANAADYLIKREGIDTAIVFGIVDDQLIDGSFRTRSQALDPDKFIKELVGADQNGDWMGGGRLDKGGFRIPVGVFANCADRELLWRITEKTLKGMLYKKIGYLTDDSN
ncbi:MAG: bifunctional oligoribonuclease/PAP phosphatase NrnA [Planctomycetota bacterium]